LLRKQTHVVETIHLRGVRTHNLKNVNVALPLGRLIVVTGVSGAGKSSLAFDTLYAEAQRRYLQSFSAYTRQFLERLDKPDADQIENLPPAVAITRDMARGPRATVGTMSEIIDYLRLLWARAGTVACARCGQEVRAQRTDDVTTFVENLPLKTRLILAFPSRPEEGTSLAAWIANLLEEGFVRLHVGGRLIRIDTEDLPYLPQGEDTWVVLDRWEVGQTPHERLTDSIETAFAHGHGRLAILMDNQPHLFEQHVRCPRCNITYEPPEPRHLNFNDPLGACPVCSGTGTRPKRRNEKCPECRGIRLGELALRVRLGGKNLAEACALSVAELAGFCRSAELSDTQRPAAEVLLQQIQARLASLQSMELGYLTLDRAAATLSAGEAQRVRLVTALGSTLVNALYVLDEPTAGLHPRDTKTLLDALKKMRDAGNTLVLVEHQMEVIAAADYVIDLGPGAGEEGGEVIYQGLPEGLAECPDSITGAYLSGRRRITPPTHRRPLTHGSIRLAGASLHNLKNLTVDFPLGVLCVITGVSGAGKTTLMQHVLFPALCRQKHKRLPPGFPDDAVPVAEIHGAGQIGDVVLMDQTPLARVARSNPATYLKIFDDIRQVFADTPEARIRSLGPGAFSFNQPGGRCETCEGQGTLTVDMQFLADVTMTCPDCRGTRFKPELLGVKVRDLNIAEVLELTVREAFRFFRAQKHIERRLKLLLDVGLDYLRLGQAANTLSGGECQRLKLAAHLASNRKPRCLFLLNEPTAGLHPADTARLLDCFDRLLATGHSLIVVEYNLDVIRSADHVIDMGPGAAEAGGRVVATGTPEDIARTPESVTGKWLRPLPGALCMIEPDM
jgi:excinuclease ABC subunit A